MFRLSGLALLSVLLTLSPAPVRAGEDIPDPDLGAPLAAIEKAVRTAAIVVEGEPEKFRSRSSRAIFRVTTSLKGDADPKRPIMVDFQKAPYGTWPKPGMQAVLCLSSRGGSRYSFQLASYYASVLPATQSVKSAIRDILVPKGRAPGRKKKRVSAPREEKLLPRVELAEQYVDMVVESETVLVGALTDIGPSGEGLVGTFKVEEAVVGYGGFKAPLRVKFVSKGAAPPSAGRYVLFLRGSETGDGFRTISRGSGAVRLADPAEEVKIKRAVAALADATGPGRLGLTTVQAALAEWQEAWNARDLARCIRCYSPRCELRKQHEGGGEGRKRLARQIRSYPGRVRLAVRRVERSRVFAGRGRETATVTVLLTLSAGDMQDRRTAKMKFVREGRQWLILDEGF